MSDSAAWPAGVGHIALPVVDSTNAEAMRRAATLDAPTWISAVEQTTGRGRRARAWTSPPGNLYATLIMVVNDPPQITALWSFVAALALHDTLSAFGATLALKWPNDVLMNGGKVAGILLEAQTIASRSHLAIGIGVNLASHPQTTPDAAAPPTSVLSQTGMAPDPATILATLATRYATREACFRTHGFAPIRADWLAHAARLGQPIRARTGDISRDGTFQTIDPHGNLILAMTTGTVAIPAAEVFFP